MFDTSSSFYEHVNAANDIIDYANYVYGVMGMCENGRRTYNLFE